MTLSWAILGPVSAYKRKQRAYHPLTRSPSQALHNEGFSSSVEIFIVERTAQIVNAISLMDPPQALRPDDRAGTRGVSQRMLRLAGWAGDNERRDRSGDASRPGAALLSTRQHRRQPGRIPLRRPRHV